MFESQREKKHEREDMSKKSISVNFGRGETRVCRSAGKGRRTTLVSEYVSSSRSSLSQALISLLHYVIEEEDEEEGGGRGRRGTACKTPSTQ